MSHSIAQMSAHTLLEGLQQKTWSSQELTQYFIDRIDELNPKYHAIHTLSSQALKQAESVDNARHSGEKILPLAGLPMTLKDAFACQGLPSTYGLQLYRFNKPRWESQVVTALKQAGVIILGRSAMPSGSFDWNCKNQIFPECVNPHDPLYSPGGSSGGAAAALALGLTPLELGSDMAGSIRYPAHCCGVYGLRTTDGWLPMDDMGPSPKQGLKNMVACGPMARSLDDLNLMLEVFSNTFPQRRLKPVPAASKPLRIAFSRDLPEWPVDDDTAHLFESWLSDRKAEGHLLIEASPLQEEPALHSAWSQVAAYEMLHTLPPLPQRLRQFIINQMMVKKLGPGWFGARFLDGLKVSHSTYLQALAQLRSIQNQGDRFFETFDAWVLPASPTPARLLKESGSMMDTQWGPLPYSDLIASYHCVTTMLGTPVLSIPIGKSSGGLPIGIQVHGPRFGDRRLLAQFQALNLPSAPLAI